MIWRHPLRQPRLYTQSCLHVRIHQQLATEATTLSQEIALSCIDTVAISYWNEIGQGMRSLNTMIDLLYLVLQCTEYIVCPVFSSRRMSRSLPTLLRRWQRKAQPQKKNSTKKKKHGSNKFPRQLCQSLFRIWICIEMYRMLMMKLAGDVLFFTLALVVLLLGRMKGSLRAVRPKRGIVLIFLFSRGCIKKLSMTLGLCLWYSACQFNYFALEKVVHERKIFFHVNHSLGLDLSLHRAVSPLS